MINKNLAAVISFILPGVGQYLEGGGNIWILVFVIIALTADSVMYVVIKSMLLANLIYWVCGAILAYHAYKTGPF